MPTPLMCRRRLAIWAVLLGFACVMLCGRWVPAATAVSRISTVSIVVGEDGSALRRLAAREIRRYIYLRTDRLIGVVDQLPSAGNSIFVTGKDNALLKQLADSDTAGIIGGLGAQQYLLKRIESGGRKILLVVGGDDIGVLYGGYRLAEHFGVRFYLHGDVVGDKKIALSLPDVNETGKPLFELRGVNPWGSHPFGFDQWSKDDYKAVFGRLVRMRMNFLGIHCYPEGAPYAEPTVWLGLTGDFDRQGCVRSSYPANYYNTQWKGRWGPILPKKTSSFSFGGGLLFGGDDWGPDVLADYYPRPETLEACNEVFNRTGEQFRDAFSFARQLGIKTCVGTESPMRMPQAVRRRLESSGRNPDDPGVVRDVYEGIFRRIMAAHPLDYYWIWTPEYWTWQGNTSEHTTAVYKDIELAAEALKNVGSPFRLATSGWVLGPNEDRAGFDRVLSKDVAMSAISRQLGKSPVDAAFSRIIGRDKWAIPWLEGDSDNGLAAVQLWVGRMRKDASDAHAYGCTGLMGLHWRTEILAPNASALAQAAWDQSGWNPDFGKPARPVAESEGPLGGKTARYPDARIAGTGESVLYQTCRYDLAGYRLNTPPGRCRITLKFCEPHFASAGKRIFDVKLQGKTVLKDLDIFAKAGQFTALDYTFDDIPAAKNRLDIEFVPRVSLPCISAIAVEGAGFVRKINCGGSAWNDYAADGSQTPAERFLGVEDFYADWAEVSFGREVGADIARIFTRIDGKVPPSVSGGCPSGSLRPDGTPWQQVAAMYAFIDELEQMRDKVKGSGNLDRYDYWLNTFRYHRSLHRIRCTLGRFNAAMKTVNAETDAADKKKLAAQSALPVWRQLLQYVGECYGCLLSTVNSNGALATVVNLENHSQFWPVIVEEPLRQLADALGGPLPPDAMPPERYLGKPRLVVPTVRSLLDKGESLKLTVILLDNEPPREIALYWRLLGRGPFRREAAGHVAKAIYEVQLPSTGDDFEYYIKARTSEGNQIIWPAAAPTINQTVVVMP